MLIGDTKEKMLWAQRALIQMLRDLGFGISWDKMSGPAQNNIVYLGVLFDSINMELFIPPDKMSHLYT